MLFKYFSRACRRREVIGFLNPSFLISSSNFATKSTTDCDDVCNKTKKKKKKSKAMLSKEKKSELDADWLRSLSPPMKHDEQNTTGNGWILGIDPDNEGAIAVLKPSTTASPDAQVYDTPTVKLMFTKSERDRLDAQSIISLLQSFGAPSGSVAYVEAAGPRPFTSRSGCLNMGFSYGIWLGILVSSGFSIYPVISRVWKKYFCLQGGLCNKDESRALACHFFPSLSSQLNKKSDHGGADEESACEDVPLPLQEEEVEDCVASHVDISSPSPPSTSEIQKQEAIALIHDSSASGSSKTVQNDSSIEQTI